MPIRHSACHRLALTGFFDPPGDGRTHTEIPAADLSWALPLGGILRLGSATRLEWLANFGHRKDLGLTRAFGDDALAYFTGRVDPEVIRRRTAETLKVAKYKKAATNPLAILSIFRGSRDVPALTGRGKL